MEANDKKIILFDGVCNLCSQAVQFILEKDRKDQFLFGSLQGKHGQEYLTRFHLPADRFHSFLLIENGRLYTRSSAALRILKQLGGIWQWWYAAIIIPRPLRDAVYNWIARNRYAWFGRKTACWLPSPAWQKKFLD